MHSRLREATADQHQRLDRGLQYLLDDALTVDRYADLIAALYGFYTPFEEHLSRCEAASGPASLPLIRRAGLLERDLRALGRGAECLPTCTDLPDFPTADHTAGAIYVVEGACLGGQVIARALMQRLAITRDSGAAFFIGSGAQTGPRWKQVLAWLDQRQRRAVVRPDDMAAGACATFAALSRWLMAREVLDA